MEIDWFVDGLFWRHPDREWDAKVRGADSRSKGDVIFNTLKRHIDLEDRSTWAYLSLVACADLLMEGKRWPDFMIQEDDCKGWGCFYVQKIKFQIIKWFKADSIHIKHGHQKCMSRDPWIMFFVACYKMNRFQFFDLKPQWWLYTPNVWRWMRYLRTGDPRYKKRYLRFLRPNKREYVQRLHYYIGMTL